MIIIAAFLVLQAIGLGVLSLIVYQATPNNVLARQTIIGKIPGILSMVRLADRVSNSFYRGPKAPDPLPHYKLEIDSEDLKEIEKALPKELPSSWYGNLFLTEEAKVWVKGKFTADGKEYSVKVRVRGDLFNHWAYRKKSWRVKFDKDNLFNGIREMNLIIPEDRGWTAEPFNVYRAHKMGLLHPPTQFVTVSLNGSSPLIYTQMEHWGKEMLEKQGRPGDVNLYQTGGGTSEYQQWDAVFTDLAYWDKYEKSAFAPHDSYEEVELLLKLSEKDAHKDPLYKEKLRSVIDMDRLISWYGISLLSGSRHVRDHNLRLFFDPSKGRFEPIPWDISLYGPMSLFSLAGNPFLNEAMRDPILRLKVHRFVWEYIQDEKNIEDDLNQMKYLRAMVEEAAYRDPLKLPSNRTVERELNSKLGLLEKNFAHLKEELNKSEVLIDQIIPAGESNVIAIFDITTRGPASSLLTEFHLPFEMEEFVRSGNLQLWRDSPLRSSSGGASEGQAGDDSLGEEDVQIPLEVREEPSKKEKMVVLTSNEEASLIWPDEAELDEAENLVAAPHTRHRFFLVLDEPNFNLPPDVYPINFDIRNAVTGKKSKVIGEALVDQRTFEHLDEVTIAPDEFVQKNPAFKLGKKDEVTISGNVTIKNDTIIPSTVSKFTIKPGTKVSLGSGASIISYAPVEVVGSKSAPIIFSRSDSKNKWGTFAVLNASGSSEIKWSEFYGGGDEFINGAYFSGMVAFHGSEVSVSESVFSGASGDDGLNLKYVKADIKNCLFENNQFDGLDIDFATSGSVEDSLFIDNGNDGIDISWSPIEIKNIEVMRSGDKCISVGERSTPKISDSILEDCQIGLAVKDSSEVEADSVTFKNNEVGVAAYIKKPIFSAPSVKLKNCEFIGNGKDKDEQNGAKIIIE